LIGYIKEARLAKLSNGASGVFGTESASSDNFIWVVSVRNPDYSVGVTKAYVLDCKAVEGRIHT
jgi:hypothetical protein